jgi:hypothetical protein
MDRLSFRLILQLQSYKLYSVVHCLASPAVKHVMSVEFRDGTLLRVASLVTACLVSSMVVAFSPSLRTIVLEIMTKAATSPAV